MRLLTLATALSFGFAGQAFSEPTPIDVKKTNGCGCCLAWMDHLEENGFAPSGQDMFAGLLVRFKLDSGVPQRMVSCHTGLIDGYVIEGHVPADDIRRLLSERPDAVGLAVPGMPLGSPGMDQSRWREAYDVFLINKDGSTEVFASYPGD
ncbi:DUF411 domain-containing protein [Sulfitobacter sp. JB4-11]|jgi:hypothetical protein|uniref:DUF411 domain-containing protein n=1 Tax=Sulfitobacter rhodophyticola TaxID=3238304 RepID=UPI00351739EB